MDPQAAAFLERYLSDPSVLMAALSDIDPSVGRRIREAGTIRGGQSPFKESVMPGEVSETMVELCFGQTSTYISYFYAIYCEYMVPYV